MDAQRPGGAAFREGDRPDGVGGVSLQYQIVEPGDYIKLDDARYEAAASWTMSPCSDNGQNGDLVAGDERLFRAHPRRRPGPPPAHPLPDHRRRPARRHPCASPYADDPQPNFAYFVYDGVPAWSGSKQPRAAAPVNYLEQPSLGPPAISSDHAGGGALQCPIRPAHPKRTERPRLPQQAPTRPQRLSLERRACFDGVVYDHIRFRARGGVWRYAMGKNMWKFDFNNGHDFDARDNYGR